MASTDNLSMALDHDVHISLSAQNKICILEFSGKVISPNVLTLAAVYFRLAGFESQHCHIRYLTVEVYHCRAMFICTATTVRSTTLHMEETV